jgi:hypothetical protein
MNCKVDMCNIFAVGKSWDFPQVDVTIITNNQSMNIPADFGDSFIERGNDFDGTQHGSAVGGHRMKRGLVSSSFNETT